MAIGHAGALAALALTVGLAACGGAASRSSTTSGAATTSPPAMSGTAAASVQPTAGPIAVAADASGQLAFTRTSLRAKAGTVTIHFTNASPLAHNLTLERGTSGGIVAATPTFQGGTHTLTAHLAPGTYTFFCSVPGHRMAGMQGTLVVR